MEFRILGPLDVVEQGRSLQLGGARQRAVLAVLLTRANEVVSSDRLIDELWADEPPRTATNTLQYYVSQLRKILGADRIQTKAPGYLVRVERGELDLERFERLLARGDAESLHEALALWRGSALADFAYEPFARDEIARLEELRVAALEKRIDADLARGRHAELAGELELLIAQHPLRERLRAQLMLALYRSGRQAEALEAYRAARSALVDELGIDPGPVLQELERAILRQDPSLELAGSPAAAGGGTPDARRSILVVVLEGAVDELLSIAEPLAVKPVRELILARFPADGRELGAVTRELAARRDSVRERGGFARVASYTSPSPGDEAAQLAVEQDVDLAVVDAPGSLLERDELGGDLDALLRTAPCDVGVVVKATLLDAAAQRPVVVPFGGVDHDWSAIEIAAWIARSRQAPLRLTGTEAIGDKRRDASRLLARASMVLQAAVGIVAEPMLVAPGPAGVISAADDAALVVLGLSERWRVEGVGAARLDVARACSVPTMLIRTGIRPGGLAPPEAFTRFTWTMAAR
jgi:DNA-binding SARP family transcriptional activator